MKFTTLLWLQQQPYYYRIAVQINLWFVGTEVRWDRKPKTHWHP
jgi:hypothetical protein